MLLKFIIFWKNIWQKLIIDTKVIEVNDSTEYCKGEYDKNLTQCVCRLVFMQMNELINKEDSSPLPGVVLCQRLIMCSPDNGVIHLGWLTNRE